jgi:hypothetical protein
MHHERMQLWTHSPTIRDVYRRRSVDVSGEGVNESLCEYVEAVVTLSGNSGHTRKGHEIEWPVEKQ